MTATYHKQLYRCACPCRQSIW